MMVSFLSWLETLFTVNIAFLKTVCGQATVILRPVSDWPFIPSHDEVHNDTAQLTDGVIRSSTPMPADELDDSDDGMASSAAWRPCMKIYMYFFLQFL